MASPRPTGADHLEAPPPSPLAEPQGARPSPRQRQATLTDGVLEQIFRRVPDPADLARASVACPTFLRIITDYARRFRQFHPPALLGLVSLFDFVHFHGAELPHPSAVAARAFDRAANFTSSFLPPCCEPNAFWMPVDCSDGRVLMADIPILTRRGDGYQFSHLLVCDPLYRRYVRLPPIPDDLTASFRKAVEEIFLLPPEDGEEGRSFRAVYMLRSSTNLVAFVFFSRTGEWHAAPFHDWSAVVGVIDSIKSILSCRSYACGCIYWQLEKRNKMVVLKTSSMEFSTVDVPPSNNMKHIGVVDAGGGRIGMFSLSEHTGSGNCNLHYTIRLNEGQWHLERIIPFPLNYEGFTIVGATRYLVLWGSARSSGSVGKQEFVSLDVKTFEFQRIGMNYLPQFEHPCPYFGYLILIIVKTKHMKWLAAVYSSYMKFEDVYC